MKLIQIQTTCECKKQAQKIAKELIQNKLAACAQITKIKSYYMWKNEFCKDNETLLNIKTKKQNFKKVKRKIKELHSYDLPQIIALPIKKSSKEYKNFIKENTK